MKKELIDMKKKTKKKIKLDLIAMALFTMAKKHYNKCDEYVTALYEHYGVKQKDQSDCDLWCSVIDQDDFEETDKYIKERLKELKRNGN